VEVESTFGCQLDQRDLQTVSQMFESGKRGTNLSPLDTRDVGDAKEIPGDFCLGQVAAEADAT
jgi:hypothetical protein